MIFEVCVDNIETAMVADKLGCHRVELCSALSVGGLTPSYGLMKACVEQTALEVHVMIRHQAGNFVVSDGDLEIMKCDVKMAQEIGAKGVVFGALKANNEIDAVKSKILVDLAKSLGLAVTFHRAFDFVPDPFKSLNLLISLGVNRILTSGQQPKAINGLDLIKKLVKVAEGNIEIMAGSGVSAQHAIELSKSGIDALHFTANLKSANPLELGMGEKSLPDELKIRSILQLFP